MSREERKRDHVRFALEGHQVNPTGLEDIHFVHQSLPESSLSACSMQTTLGELTLSSPFLVNAMTGGAPEVTVINRELSIAAASLGMPIAVGSQRNALLNQDLIPTYRVVREVNPNGVVFANLGAGASVHDADKAVNMLLADALQLHLNVPQELAMPEGDRSFNGMLESIRKVVDRIRVPVIVKEVGFGMSAETIQLLTQAGVSAIDVAGKGGTNFIQIENRRSTQPLEILETWGQTTAVSLLEASLVPNCPSLVGSGGIQTSLDAAKCMALGASVVGAAGFWLKTWKQRGLAGLQTEMEKWHAELRVILTMLGCQNPKELQQVPLVVVGFTAEWCRARGISLHALGTRKKHMIG